MAKPLNENERDKLRKVISVMRSATIEGERIAAQVAAERIAAANGLTLEEAELEAFPEEDDGHLNHDERTAQRREAERWAANMVRMTEAYESSERYRVMMAREEARRRGMQDDGGEKRRAHFGPKNPRTYIPGKADEFRLIASLLRDGVGLARTAEILGISTIAVARVWLLTRGNRKAA